MYDMEYAKAIRSALEPLVLDQVQELVFEMELVQDATVARALLPRMPRLRRLDLNGRTYAHTSATRRSCPKRRSTLLPQEQGWCALDLSSCYRISSGMVHELLATCLGLVAFAAPWLKASSMVSEASEDSSSS